MFQISIIASAVRSYHMHIDGPSLVHYCTTFGNGAETLIVQFPRIYTVTISFLSVITYSMVVQNKFHNVLTLSTSFITLQWFL